MNTITITVSDRYYTKDPFSSDLGKRIISEAVLMIDELGFEDFTFKKLASRIGSTEASMYRYFDNKQKLLIFLTAWYWSWADFLIDYETHHIKDPMERLNRVWEILCHVNVTNEKWLIDLSTLRRIVIKESDKTYLTKHVDEINKEGLFLDFKALCNRIADMVKLVRPEYPYSHALVSTMMEASHQQNYFAIHLPSLTEIDSQSESPITEQVHVFVMDIMNRILNK